MDLMDAVSEIENGLTGVALGNELFKKRIAGNGKGKSGGYRTILCFRRETRIIFVYIFSKNEQNNLSKVGLRIYKDLASRVLKYSDSEMESLTRLGNFRELPR